MTVRGDGGRVGDVSPVHGAAFGVPYVAWLPAGGESAPLVVGWHLIDPPSSEAALATALPMTRLPARRAYLGLPLTGARSPQRRCSGH